MCPINQYPKSEVATNVKMQNERGAKGKENMVKGNLNSKEQSQVFTNMPLPSHTTISLMPDYYLEQVVPQDTPRPVKRPLDNDSDKEPPAKKADPAKKGPSPKEESSDDSDDDEPPAEKAAPLKVNGGVQRVEFNFATASLNMKVSFPLHFPLVCFIFSK